MKCANFTLTTLLLESLPLSNEEAEETTFLLKFSPHSIQVKAQSQEVAERMQADPLTCDGI